MGQGVLAVVIFTSPTSHPGKQREKRTRANVHKVSAPRLNLPHPDAQGRFTASYQDPPPLNTLKEAFSAFVLHRDKRPPPCC